MMVMKEPDKFTVSAYLHDLRAVLTGQRTPGPTTSGSKIDFDTTNNRLSLFGLSEAEAEVSRSTSTGWSISSRTPTTQSERRGVWLLMGHPVFSPIVLVIRAVVIRPLISVDGYYWLWVLGDYWPSLFADYGRV